MGRRIVLTDCTLRDGSYQNDFGFTAEDTSRLSADLDRAGFPEIEVGHGLGLLGASRFSRPAGASDEAYIHAARESVRRGKLGVFAIPGIATPQAVSKAAKQGIDFLKIGVVAGQADQAEELVKTAQDSGITPFLFFMQSSLVAPESLAKNAVRAARWSIPAVYVVDSAGFMIPDDVTRYVSAIREHTGLEVGFHGHNNLHLVMANVIAALNAGASRIDCTLRGLGRSAGNPQSEALALVMRRLGYEINIDVAAAFVCAETHVNARLPGHGNDSIDMAVGYAGLHSRFLPEVERIAREEGVDSIPLLLALGARGQATDRLDLVTEVARTLKKTALERAAE